MCLFSCLIYPISPFFIFLVLASQLINGGTCQWFWYVGDDVVRFKFGEKSAQKLSSSGFIDVTFKEYTAYVIFSCLQSLSLSIYIYIYHPSSTHTRSKIKKFYFYTLRNFLFEFILVGILKIQNLYEMLKYFTNS